VATLVDAVVGLVMIGIPLGLTIGKKTTVHTTGGTSTTYNLHGGQLGLLAALAIVYYVLFEVTIGATPGKLLLGLRVRTAAGARCTLWAALARNVLRVVDAFPYVVPYLAGAMSIWADGGVPPNRRRIGDRIAGTVVIYR
jgi:uncharacterized RDD family membrane protein YckC